MSPEERRCRKLLPIRSDGLCEIRAPGCDRHATVASHRKRRAHCADAEKWCMSNVLHGCWWCEHILTIQDTDPEVRDRGWTLPSHADPAKTPVRYRNLVPLLLTPSGGFSAAPASDVYQPGGVA